MKKIVKLFVIIMIIVLAGCSNTETQEPPRQRTTGEKVALVTEFIIDNAIYNGYDLVFGREIIKSKSVSQSDSVTTTGIDASGNLNTHTTTKTTTKTKSKGAGFGIGIGDY